MITEIKELNKKFLEIKKMGWIKESGGGSSKIGITFEKAIGKRKDDFPVADFYDIEIKTMNSKAKSKLHLLTLSPDGDYLFPIKRVLDNLGYQTKDSLGKKIFYQTFNGREYSIMPFQNRGKLIVDWKKNKIKLFALNHNNEEIEINVSWSFDYLQERLNKKLKYLAIVRASSRIINNIGYFHYYQINYYQLKDFTVFIKLIEQGIITITFTLGVFKSGKRQGQTYDHGTNFSIDIENINQLYDEIKIKNY